MRGLLTGILLLGVLTCVRGQIITAETFFSRPLPTNEASLSAGQDLGAAPRMPWIERYEFRTETRDLDAASQEYTLRLLPSTPGKRKAQQSLSNTLENRPDFERQELTCEAIEDRYEDWLKLFVLTEEVRMLRELDLILRDRETVLGKMAGSLDVDYRELLRLRTDRTDLQLRAGEAQRQRDLLLATAGLAGDSLSFAGFVEPEALSIAGNGDELATNGAELNAETAYDLSLIEQELALERAGQRQYLDFAQFKYQGPRVNPFEERFSIGLGFQLPNRGNDKLKIRELELERADLLQEVDRDQQEADRDEQVFNTRFSSLLAAYGERKRAYREEATYLNDLGGRVTAAAAATPLFLLDIRERYLRNELRLLDARDKLTDLYLGYLKSADSLCTQPDGSWLRE
ncbi:hypothetical protein [Lewinella sp. 4G2]|uniref:hypothetical protein n=1 Tax=Lewinella sp. 4G2 TaxID=1803372 RepID=UPI0007B4D802|nr:hypothetical protein [Lewinella sp. 4G2]OAV43308.1 hypothetical protein A3850_001815 [Lewinella sp. 4G2]